ncbi:hypothetical protein Plhal304r1_c015g0055231 [Plasmopara halstedii]
MRAYLHIIDKASPGLGLGDSRTRSNRPQDGPKINATTHFFALEKSLLRDDCYIDSALYPHYWHLMVQL